MKYKEEEDYKKRDILRRLEESRATRGFLGGLFKKKEENELIELARNSELRRGSSLRRG